ncbi:MAG: ABC transporter, permease protein 1 (cluster 1, maltose/g3p/polyamine/iron), partial [uncultured Friedmanniella sp.]
DRGRHTAAAGQGHRSPCPAAPAEADLRPGQLHAGVPRGPAGDLRDLRGVAVPAGGVLLADELERVHAHPDLRGAGQLHAGADRLDLPPGDAEQHHPRGGAAAGDDRAGPGARLAAHRRRQQPRPDARPAGLGLLPRRLLLPLRDPGHRHRHHVEPDLRPERRHPQRAADPDRRGERGLLPLARRRAHRDAGDDLRHRLGLRRLLHGAVRGGDQGHPGRDLRGRPDRRGRPAADRRQDHGPADPRQRADGLRLHGHPRARRVRLHGGAEPRRRAEQLDPGDVAAAAEHGLHQGPVRRGVRHGRRARGDHPGLLGPGVPRQPPAERQGGGAV